jgi:hypothetical protein
MAQTAGVEKIPLEKIAKFEAFQGNGIPFNIAMKMIPENKSQLQT